VIYHSRIRLYPGKSIASAVNLPEDTGFNGEDYTMTQYQDSAQNPEGEQFYPEENPEV
jgi:hypothetical protein